MGSLSTPVIAPENDQTRVFRYYRVKTGVRSMGQKSRKVGAVRYPSKPDAGGHGDASPVHQVDIQKADLFY